MCRKVLSSLSGGGPLHNFCKGNVCCKTEYKIIFLEPFASCTYIWMNSQRDCIFPWYKIQKYHELRKTIFSVSVSSETSSCWSLHRLSHTMCRNYLFIVELEKSVHKNWMGRLPYFHVRMNYFWWAKTERLVIYSAVNLLFRNNKIQLSTCHHLSIYMHCKISFTYLKHFAL